MKSHFKTKLVVAALAMAAATGASAATLLSFGITGVGSYTVNTGNITAATATKTLPGITLASGTTTPAAFAAAGLSDGLLLTFSTLTFNTSLVPFAPFTLTAGLLTFTFTNMTNVAIVPSGATSNGSISQQFNGTVTGDASVGTLFLGQTASISETCTQTSIGASITCSDSLITPGLPTQVPEPTTIALLGAALAGLGAIRRRRQEPQVAGALRSNA